MPAEKQRVTRTCPICGKTFVSTTAWERKRECCSNLCARRLKALRSVVVKTCRICGKTFESTSRNNEKSCPDCRAAAARARAERNGYTATMRRCHDCGRPTTDFRCPACWAKIRIKNGIPVSVDEERT